MPGHVKSGYQSNRPDRAALMTAEFKALYLTDQVKDLNRALIRLRAAIRDYLEALPSDRGPMLVRLRNEMNRAMPSTEARS